MAESRRSPAQLLDRSLEVMKTLHATLVQVSPLIVACLTGHAAAQQKLADWSGETGVYGAGAQFGGPITGLGDIDGDGVPDALIGAPDEGTSAGTSPGAIYVISGATGAWLDHELGDADVMLFGYAVCAPGDLDGDGITDYLVGEPDGLFNSKGRVYGYSGASGNELFALIGPEKGSFFGFQLSRLGDVDADGILDFGVGSISPGTGSVYIYSGASHSVLYSFHGSNSGANKYVSVGLGDIDGDGHADFGIGAPIAGPNQEGEFSVYSGATRNQIYRLTGENHSDWFGLRAAQVGDIDRDGHVDFLISAPGHCINTNGSEGRVYLYSAATGTLQWSVDGSVYNEQLGHLPTDNGVIDFNRDGFPDITIGSIARNLVHVYSGRNGTLPYDIRGGADDRSMCSTNSFSDLDADNFDDLLVGVPDNRRYYGGADRAYVFGGNDLFLRANQSSYVAGDSFNLQTTGGEPSALAATVLTNVNGTATFLPVALANLDVNGALAISGTVPSGLSGITVSFMAYAVRASGHGVVDSIPETVTFQ